MRSDRQRLEDILWAISSIEKEFELERYNHDSIYRFGIVKYLEIIGEASRYVSETVKQKSAQIEWSKIIGFRNLAVHQYFELDWDVVLDIINVDLPELKLEVQALIAKVDS